MSARHLIVNADDFGLSEGVNRGIVQAHEHGILTSASLMVRWPAASAAAQYALAHPRLSVGLHVELGEWVFVQGEWRLKYEVVPARDQEKVFSEVWRQIELFRGLLKRNPTHLDSHQHAHREEPVLSVMRDAAAKLSVPLRSFTPGIRYCGDFYGQTGEGDPYPEGIRVESLLKIFEGVEPGTTELGCHPGDDRELDSAYRLERLDEVKALCAPAVRQKLAALDIDLWSFCDIR